MDVAVIGGGIGGMAAALGLARHGASVTVYEQAEALREVGAGLQISVNGQQVLRALGVVGGVPSAATVSRGTVMCDGARGRVVTRIPAPAGGPTWYLHRADLLAMLVDAARAAGVRVALARQISPGQIKADLIVAADGAQSGFRAAIDGPCDAQFSGQVAWRAMVPGTMEAQAVLAMGRGAHVVRYPLRDQVNLVAVEERRAAPGEGWRQPGDVAEFRARFAPFGGALTPLIEAVDTVHWWALHLRPVAARWHRENMVLLGDAAHPVLPFMAQGACLALEDAWVLAHAVSRFGLEGLARYEAARKDRAARIVALSAGNAWRFHLGKPWAYGAQAVLAAGAPVMARRLEWVYDYDALNAI